MPIIFITYTQGVSAAETQKTLEACKGNEFIELQDGETLRLPPSTQETKHYIYIRDAVNGSSATIKESKRKSQIITDLITLAEDRASLKEENKCLEYKQSYKRATVEVRANSEKDNKVAATFIAGPAEHFYLAFDMPLTDVKQLTFDSESNSVAEKEKPSTFYASLNFQLGDIFTNHKGSNFYKNISIKGMISAGESPDNSVGLGLSYSAKYADLFVARVRTESGGDINADDVDSTIFGISFPLTKKPGWLD